MQASYLVKIYDSAGTTLQKVLNPEIIKNDISFSTQINGGQGALTLNLNLDFFDFDEGTIIDYENIVRIYLVNDANTSGKLIYTGFVSYYKPYIEGTNQGVEVNLLGLPSLLTRDYFKNGAAFTVSYAGGSDIADIFEDIIDQYQTVTGNTLINYTTNINTTGVTPTIDIVEKTWWQALQEVFKLTPAGWFWRISETGEVYLEQQPSSATHSFKFQYDLQGGYTEKTAERVINDVTVNYNGGTYNDNDATSISAYGKRAKYIDDQDIGNAATAQARAEKEVDDNKDPKLKTRLEINDLYSFEDIDVGDTCKVLNIATGNPFGSNMLITATKYSTYFMGLTIDDYEQNYSKTLDNFIKQS